MQYTRPVPVSALLVGLLTLSIGSAALAQAPATAPQPSWGIWAPKELRFTYMGFTSHYSCDGLRDKMRAILLQLGARPDLKLREVPCAGGAGRPTEFPGVTVNMNVLTPFDPASSNATATPVPAHWKTVVISTDMDPLREAGDCELIEQVKSRVLPLFHARAVDYRSTCIPNQLQVGGTLLKADVLIADEPGTPPPGAQAPAPPPGTAPAPR
ncbi:MAG: hypothetical protein JO203_08345 [Gammaproteobacteria bacterium]|nr:hypothetical protein [Gammaproteobacteria bacterium]